MKIKKPTSSLFFFLQIFFVSIGIAQTKVINLKCEYLTDPIGLDTQNPRFTWQAQNKSDVFLQSAYQLIVGSNKDEIIEEKGDVWNSGIINTTAIPVVYE